MISVITAHQINREGIAQGNHRNWHYPLSTAPSAIAFTQVELFQLHTQAVWAVRRKDFFNDDFGLPSVL